MIHGFRYIGEKGLVDLLSGLLSYTYHILVRDLGSRPIQRVRISNKN